MACGFSSVDGSIAVGAPLGVGGVQGGGEGPGVVSKVVLIIELGSLNLELEPEATRGSEVRVSADWGSGLLPRLGMTWSSLLAPAALTVSTGVGFFFIASACFLSFQ